MENYNDGMMTTQNNPMSIMTNDNPASLALAQRSAKEVEAMVIMAKRFPRDEIVAREKILASCKRPKLAETAVYEYPRGGQKVTGVSIRLMEVISQCWGNLKVGWEETSRSNGISHCLAYAWDLENNNYFPIQFDVPHTRDTKQGKQNLTDDRDIYELCANMAARRVRACLQKVIPADIVEEAREACEDAQKVNQQPIAQRVEKTIEAFKKYSVPVEKLEEYIGCRSTAFTHNDIYRLVKALNSIRDGMAEPSDYFRGIPSSKAKISKAQAAELINIANGKQKEVTNILNEFGYKDIKEVAETDFEEVKAKIVALEHFDGQMKLGV